MKYSDLLLNSARQAMTNKISWLYIFAALIGQFPASSSLLLESISPIKSISSEIWFLSTVLSMIFSAGLVYSVSQKELHNLDISILDGWRKGWSKIIQVGLLIILLLAVLFIVLFLIFITLKKTISFGILTTLTALFIRPILNFGICALVINDRSIITSVRISISIFMKNAFPTLAISSALIIIQQVLLSIIVLLFMHNYRVDLLDSPFKIFDIPHVVFWDQVLSLVLSPWIVIVFTHLFLQFNHVSEMAIVSSGQEAA